MITWQSGKKEREKRLNRERKKRQTIEIREKKQVEKNKNTNPRQSEIGERDKLSGPPPLQNSGPHEESRVSEKLKYGIPGVGLDAELRVIKPFTSRCLLATYLQIFAYEAVLLESFLAFVIKSGQYFWFVPIDGARRTVTGMFGNTRYVFVRFVRCYIVAMLSHPGAKTHTSLTDIFSFWVAITVLFVYTT